MTSKRGGIMAGSQLQQVRLVPTVDTVILFDDVTFQVAVQRDEVKVAVDSENYAVVRHRSQRTTAESAIMGAEVLEEEQRGVIDYGRYFLVDWEDAMSLPQLTFHVTPREVVRRYVRGQSIELGLIESDTYRVVYQDGVEAEFRRTVEAAFSFEFSTGFRGSFWKDPDGSYTISFRGDRLDDQDEDQKSQSKFIISRCKYSGNLLLILQDDATVYLG
jgi:hypothetical protein